jgi:hypothetical protein
VLSIARQPAEADIANICRRENPVSAFIEIPPCLCEPFLGAIVPISWSTWKDPCSLAGSTCLLIGNRACGQLSRAGADE